MNKTIKIILFVIMLAVFIFGGYKLFVEPEENTDETEVITAEKKTDQAGKSDDKFKSLSTEAALPVTVLRIKTSNLPLRLPISATAEVWEKTTLKAEVTGTIEKIHCKIGDKVKRGQLLIKFDDEEQKLAVERARATRLTALSKYLIEDSVNAEGQDQQKMTEADKKELKEKETAFKKAQADFKKGKISESKMDKISEEYQEYLVYKGVLRDEIRQAMEGLSDATVGLKIAQLDLKRTSIRSPFPGIISELKVSTGEKISSGQELLKVVNLQSVYLKGFALESEVDKLQTGKMVRIKFDAHPEKPFYGKIQSISPEIDSTNKTINIYINVDNKDNLILPGMHAEIDVEYKVYENILKVPREAVIVRQRPLVFAVRGKIAEWIYVTLGPKNDENQVITSGLKDGDLIVIDGHLTLAHQSKVRIVKTIEQKD